MLQSAFAACALPNIKIAGATSIVVVNSFFLIAIFTGGLPVNEFKVLKLKDEPVSFNSYHYQIAESLQGV